MGKVIASCGHEIADAVGNPIEYQDYDRQGEECTVFKTVCDDCLEWYLSEMKAKRILWTAVTETN